MKHKWIGQREKWWTSATDTAKSFLFHVCDDGGWKREMKRAVEMKRKKNDTKKRKEIKWSETKKREKKQLLKVLFIKSFVLFFPAIKNKTFFLSFALMNHKRKKRWNYKIESALNEHLGKLAFGLITMTIDKNTMKNYKRKWRQFYLIWRHQTHKKILL